MREMQRNDDKILLIVIFAYRGDKMPGKRSRLKKDLSDKSSSSIRSGKKMNTIPNDWADTIVLACGLAGRLEEAGQYNIAKLLRAAADSQLRQAANSLALPEDKTALAGEVLSFVGALNSLDIGKDMIAAIKSGVMRMSEGRLPLIRETPTPYVCRTCGNLTMDKPHASCPNCGAWKDTFKRFNPIYWLDAFDPFTSLEKLRQTPMEIARMLSGRSEADLNRAPDGGSWTVRNILSHLLDAQGVLNFRVNLMLTQENPELKSLAVFDWAINDQDRPAETMEILATYRDSRQETLARLESIPLADWWLTGLHQEFGSVTVRQQVSYFALHEISHLPSIARLLGIGPAD